MQANWNSIKQKIDCDFPEVPTITTKELALWMNDSDRTQPIILDARSASEFKVSHLRGAIQVSNAKVAAKTAARLLDASNADTSDLNAEAPAIVVYCSVGYRSAKVVDKLIKRGMTNVYNLDGSIFQWFNEGRPVFQGDLEVDEVHPFDATWGKLLHR